jgi:hypothetical protein
MQTMKKLILFLMLVLSLCAKAQASVLYAVDSNSNQLFSVNPTNGSTTLIGSTGLNGLQVPAALAWDGTDMFTIDLVDGQLFKLNLSTATPTLIGTTGLNGWQGLAAHPVSGNLFAIDQSSGGFLYSINKLTGVATFIANTGVGLVTALDFDASGNLWGVNLLTGNYGTFNTTTGAYTSVGTTISGLQGLTFDSNGDAYASSTTTDSLYKLNLTNGNATLLGAMPSTGFVKGMEFDSTPPPAVPEPSTLLIFGGLTALFAGHFRRKP